MPLLDTRNNKDSLGTLISDLVLQLLSYVATTELTNIRTRQKEGIKAAKNKGVTFGRPRKNITFDYTFQTLYNDWKAKKITTKYFRESLDLRASSFYRRINDFEKLNNNN